MNKIEEEFAVYVNWSIQNPDLAIQRGLYLLAGIALVLACLWIGVFLDREEQEDLAGEPEPPPSAGPLAHWFWREHNMTDAEREAYEAEHLPPELRRKKGGG